MLSGFELYRCWVPLILPPVIGICRCMLWPRYMACFMSSFKLALYSTVRGQNVRFEDNLFLE